MYDISVKIEQFLKKKGWNIVKYQLTLHKNSICRRLWSILLIIFTN